jgi:hypothetical protein
VVLVALLERASSKQAARSRMPEERPDELPTPPLQVERTESAAEPAREAVPAPAVSERSARAILASGPPPVPPRRRSLSERRPRLPKAARPAPRKPELEPEPVRAEPPREWNLWELERAVRAAGDAERQVEWSALLIHLREFANADGDLPLEFDGLVRESFGVVLVEPTQVAAS